MSDVLRRWAWPLLIGGLALVGVLLALVDISLDNRWPSPFQTVVVGREVVKSGTVKGSPDTAQTFRFDRNQFGDKVILAAPIPGLGPLRPFLALRLFLSNGAGLVLLALAALVFFPSRARNAVERLESSHGIELALGAGLVIVLLSLAASILLGFTLLFVAVVPVVLFIALIAALFGIACISLATGRLLHRLLHLPAIHPLWASLAGALVVFDLAVIPFAGVFALAAVAMAGLGLAVVTRFGSAGGWSFGDLSW